MPDELIIAIVAGLCGMLGWGLADFFAKITIDKIGDVTSLAWGHIFGTLVLFAAAIARWADRGDQIVFSPDLQTWLFLLLFGGAQAAVYLFVYKGFGKGQIAVLNPIFASFSGLTAILSVLVFKESVGGYLLLGLAVIFSGIILLSTDFAALRARRFSVSHIPGFKEVGLATLLAAIWTLLWDRFVGGQDWLMYTFFMYAFMTMAILAVAKIQRVNLSVSNPGIWKFLALIGLCETIAYLALTLGYSSTSYTSIIALLSGAFSLPTIALARLFLKESITGLQTLGGIVVVAGIMLLSLLQ